MLELLEKVNLENFEEELYPVYNKAEEEIEKFFVFILDMVKTYGGLHP